MKYYFQRWLRVLACWLIRKTDEPEVPHARFYCGHCNSQLSILQNPLAWKSPGAQCDSCNAIISDKNIRVQLVHSGDNWFVGKDHAYRLGWWLS
ncbi:hypothetical protein HN858_03135 [Candidatus Falkowbacteria bacterium]|jgi:hypothetical protein|nr:hypothetical protein [Candidatus Falkowbacteria bacterium]MBT7348645.1 hypothetical protein [Candidatus Falkowbacteria bacterium]MBT7500436.1 hypothetical protein [Candidatus Falkowbacteria bacterium]